MVQLIKNRKTFSFAASLVAATLTLAAMPAAAGPQQGSIAAASLLGAVRNSVVSLKTAVPQSLAGLRLAEWGTAAFPTLAAAARAGLNVPAPDTTRTPAMPSAVFNSAVLPIRNLPAAAQWRPVHASLGQAFASKCSGADCLTRASSLESTIDKARPARFVEQLRLVNLVVNQMINYASDREIYGRLDYWATPSQTLQAGQGDCEDYAILKMAALKAVGIPASSMSLVVLRDRQRDLFHAILAVATDQGHYILDNAHDAILLDSQIARYQPLYSVSGERYWLHGTRRSGTQMVVSGPTSLRNIAPGEGPDAFADAAPLLR